MSTDASTSEQLIAPLTTDARSAPSAKPPTKDEEICDDWEQLDQSVTKFGQSNYNTSYSKTQRLTYNFSKSKKAFSQSSYLRPMRTKKRQLRACQSLT